MQNRGNRLVRSGVIASGRKIRLIFILQITNLYYKAEELVCLVERAKLKNYFCVRNSLFIKKGYTGRLYNIFTLGP